MLSNDLEKKQIEILMLIIKIRTSLINYFCDPLNTNSPNNKMVIDCWYNIEWVGVFNVNWLCQIDNEKHFYSEKMTFG